MEILPLSSLGLENCVYALRWVVGDLIEPIPLRIAFETSKAKVPFGYPCLCLLNAIKM